MTRDTIWWRADADGVVRDELSGGAAVGSARVESVEDPFAAAFRRLEAERVGVGLDPDAEVNWALLLEGEVPR